MIDNVLCLVITNDDQSEGIIPLYDHPHNDNENGQPLIHYHADLRYVDLNTYKTPEGIKREDKLRLTLPLLSNERLEYRELKMLKIDQEYVTPVSYIKNTKLKHKCIHKGKCPHRGYDLSNTKAVNGVISCPLHGLQFDEKTKNIITENEILNRLNR